VNVSGESGLRYLDASSPQLAPQLVLVGHHGLCQHIPYRIQALMFHRRILGKSKGAVRVAEIALV
jgi:hypothetical protein